MNNRMKFLVRDQGYCCIFAYLLANESEKEIALAAELSVSPRTIRTWRAKVRSGTLTCTKSSGFFTPVPCLMKGTQAPADTNPDTPAESSRIPEPLR